MDKTKYIDADKLAIDLQLRCDALCPYTKAQRDVMCRACLLGDAIDTVEDQPAADVEEVRRGRWIRTGEDGYCSVCKCDMPMFRNDWEWEYTETPYCPNCGARMEAE